MCLHAIVLKKEVEKRDTEQVKREKGKKKGTKKE
jgi:hypothetical protein